METHHLLEILAISTPILAKIDVAAGAHFREPFLFGHHYIHPDKTHSLTGTIREFSASSSGSCKNWVNRTLLEHQDDGAKATSPI